MPNKISGTVDRTYFSSPKFSAGVLVSDTGDRVRFRGPFCANEGDLVTLVGRWKVDPKYGPQFAADSLSYELPTSTEGLIQYLAKHPAFVGIGEATARKIVAHATSAVHLDRLIRQDIDELHRELRIRKSTLESLREAWIAHSADNDVRSYLASFGLTHHQMETLLQTFGNGVVGVLRADPYQLIRYVKGYGFKKVDKIARAMGTPKDHAGRNEAGILYIVSDELSSGHTWTAGADLLDKANDLLLLDTLDSREVIRAAAGRLLQEGLLVADGNAVTTSRCLETEQFIQSVFDLQGWNERQLAGIRLQLDGLKDRQADAYRAALRYCISVISGGAGTGKTYVLARLAKTFQDAGLRVALCSPTGKAAKRIEESLRAQGLDLEAKTIHRLLEYDGHEFNRESLSRPAEYSGQHHSSNNDDGFDVVIADECFDYKQPVLTEDGWRYIGALVRNRMNARVWSRNPASGNLELKPIVRWLQHPAPKTLLRIVAGRSKSMRGARVIRCTSEHKILTPYGYRCAGDLRIGEEVVARGFRLTNEQRSILIGSLLGDAGLNRDARRSSSQVKFVQGDDQRDYLEFKKRAFGALASELRQSKSGYGDKAVWSFTLNVTDDTHEIAQESIVTGRHSSGRIRWSPTNHFLQWIDAQALAVWFLDNGSLDTRTNADGTVSCFAKIHSQRFDRETHDRLVEHLRTTFGLSARIGNDSRGYLYLSFNKRATARLMEIVSPFTPAVMAYKVTGDARYDYAPTCQPETCTARVRSIEQVSPSTAHVYDLEVADHHNYVAGNIVVSNCSMVDAPLMAELLRRIDFTQTRLILVGDHNQLPPVGPGNVLRDIIQHSLVPTIILDEVVRQAGVLKTNSMAVLSGAIAPTAAGDPAWTVVDAFKDPQQIQVYLRELVLRKIPGRLQLDPINDVQIITPTHIGPLGTKAINQMMQRLLHGEVQRKFAVADKVIQTVNDYGLGVMNGTIGRVVAIETGPGGGYCIDFDGCGERLIKDEQGLNVQLAYALTAHKAQGSESPCAVVLCHKSHFFADRNWLYTAVTRASRYCILMGDRWGLRNAVKKNNTIRRRTFLSLWANSASPKSAMPLEVLP